MKTHHRLRTSASLELETLGPSLNPKGAINSATGTWWKDRMTAFLVTPYSLGTLGVTELRGPVNYCSK